MRFNRDLPMGWRHARLKYVARIRYGLGQPPAELDGGLPLIRATNVDHGRIVPKGLVFIDPADVPKDRDAVLRCNEIIVVRSGAYTGDSAIVPVDYAGAIAGYDMVVRVTNAVPQYIAFSLLSIPVLRDQIDLCRLRAAQPHLNAEELGDCVFALPSFDEQHAIAEFLDRKTAQIDGVIAKKQRMIDLLHEKRQALISEAVTKGLDPDVPTKDSGIEWIGRVPKHWSVERLKYSITKIEQGWSPQCDNRPAEEDEWGVLKVGCGNGYEFDSTEQKALPLDVAPLPEYEIKSGDILMSRGNTRELVGAASFVKDVRSRLMLCDLLYRFHAEPRRSHPEFLVFSLRSPHVRFQIEREASGTSASMKKVGQETIRELVLCIPPLEEQQQVIARLRPLLDQLDETVHRIESQITKLREYRQTLISAAVTGQIDVTTEGQR